MFAYLRYFSIISFFVVVAAAVLLGAYFRSIASNDLMNVVEKSSVSLAQGFINTTWREHLPNIKRLKAVDTSIWGKYKEFRAFSEDTFRYFEGVPITQISIYMPDGSRVLTINPDAEIHYAGDKSEGSISQDETTRDGFKAAIAGQTHSQIIENATFKSPSGEDTKGTVVQTFVPIMPDSFVSVIAGASSKADGIIEVYYDMTPQWDQLYLFQLVGSGGIMVIFVALIGALFFTSRKAEAIISVQHEANIELAATAAKAEAESRQKSQFLANVSHELRTPLNAIIGFSEIIKNEVMGALGNDQYMNYIRDIHSSGVHLLSLINDILDFSKAEAGKLELQLSELDATKLLKNCMRLVSPRAEQSGVVLREELPKEHFVITGDAKKLKQVMLNLLSNAVKFTPHGGSVTILAWQNVMDDSISIQVKDTGIGIAPKDIPRAMSPFGQVDSKLSRKYEGTGLGLPLTKKFVELMGGTFKIESELGAGTTITITIPQTPPRHVLKAVAKAAAEQEEGTREKQISPQLIEHAVHAGIELRSQEQKTMAVAGMSLQPATAKPAISEPSAEMATSAMPQLRQNSAPIPTTGTTPINMVPGSTASANITPTATASPVMQQPLGQPAPRMQQPAPASQPAAQRPLFNAVSTPPAPQPSATAQAPASTQAGPSILQPARSLMEGTKPLAPTAETTSATVTQAAPDAAQAQHPAPEQAAITPAAGGDHAAPTSGSRFASYAELKKMVQQKQGNN